MPQKKVYENDEVIIWDYYLAPDQKSGVHTHDKDYTFVVTKASKLQELDGKGQPVDAPPLQERDVFTYNVSEDKTTLFDAIGNGLTQPATHEAHNVGDSIYKEILIEYKNKK